jgi:hypothetical protein
LPINSVEMRQWCRFKLRTLLALPLLFSVGWVGWLWVSWPSRTISEFNGLMAKHEFEGALKRLDCDDCWVEVDTVSNGDGYLVFYYKEDSPRWFWGKVLELEPRTVLDIGLARARCKSLPNFEIITERGRILVKPRFSEAWHAAWRRRKQAESRLEVQP